MKYSYLSLAIALIFFMSSAKALTITDNFDTGTRNVNWVPVINSSCDYLNLIYANKLGWSGTSCILNNIFLLRNDTYFYTNFNVTFKSNTTSLSGTSNRISGWFVYTTNASYFAHQPYNVSGTPNIYSTYPYTATQNDGGWGNFMSNTTITYNGSNVLVYQNNTLKTNILITFLPGSRFGLFVEGVGSSTTEQNVSYANFSFLSQATFPGIITNYTLNSNLSAYVTSRQNFILNLSTDGTKTLSSATLSYWKNGTSYTNRTSTITTVSSTNYLISNAFDVPASNGVYGLYFNLFYSDGSSFILPVGYQELYDIYFTICNSTVSTPFLNITFKNETASMENVGATLSSTFIYYLGNGETSKSYSYSNPGESPGYSFCFTPSTQSLNVNLTASYSNSESQQRDTSFTKLYSSTMTTEVFYLLPTLLGQYVVFQVTNIADQVISGATVEINSSLVGNVGTRITDSAGTATFFLNPLSTYYVRTSAPGYRTLLSTIVPASTSYTIQLETDSPTSVPDCARGITYTILPSLADELNKNQYTQFNFTLVSTYWNIQSYGFSIGNKTATLNSTNSSGSATGGFLSVYANTSTYKLISINYFWKVNNSDCNATAYWIVDLTEDADWSLTTLFSDLSAYLSSGLFGLDADFGLPLLIFFTIFIFTGVMSYKFGLNSPVAISLILLALVAFFDVGLGLLDNVTPTEAIPHFPTVLLSITFIALLFREVSR